MDSAIFVNMTGLQQRLRAMATITNNLANGSTIGFMADKDLITAEKAKKANLQSRYYVKAEGTYVDFSRGPLIPTDRNLDVAVNYSGKKGEEGFIAVQTKEGEEAYTRNGAFNINKDGFLISNKGDLIVGKKGPINVANVLHVDIGNDGSVNGIVNGQGDYLMSNLGQIKLVAFLPSDLEKGEDGLLHPKADAAGGKPSPDVKLSVGMLEGSNVNIMEQLVKLVDISKAYEMQSKVMKSIEELSASGSQLLDTTK